MKKSEYDAIKVMSCVLIETEKLKYLRVQKIDCPESPYNLQNMDFLKTIPIDREEAILIRYGNKTNWSCLDWRIDENSFVWIRQSYGAKNPRIKFYPAEIIRILEMLQANNLIEAIKNKLSKKEVLTNRLILQ